METQEKYVISSLELHLFFARIMKEHALFLKAGFTPRDSSFIKQAEVLQHNFEQLLARIVSLSDGVICPKVLYSGEIITQFTHGAEMQTQNLTGIRINQSITMQEAKLQAKENPQISCGLVGQVKQLNRNALRLLNELIAFKECILVEVNACRMFTMNYPLLIEHILREAKLYRNCLSNFESGTDFTCQDLWQAELFWNQIMMEHAQFIRGLLDPTEVDLMIASNDFAEDYAALLEKAKEVNDKTLLHSESLQETLKFKQFKVAGAEGIQNCKIRSIILPLLADHVLREANHYIRLLESHHS